MPRIRRAVPALLASLVATGGAWASDLSEIQDSVVKIHSTVREPDMIRPWSKGQPSEATGSGFIIDGNRIVTNAHVVDYARRVFVQPNQSSDRLEARVIAIDSGIDLAILELEDPSFFDTHPALELSTEIPTVGATVNAIGFPLGGETMSITEGVFSRVEYSSFSEGIYGLRYQVDAPLNPGNSGGPALHNGEVIGAVFSGIGSAENIGYVIPSSEIELFLEQTLASDADGEYVGRPQFFDYLQDTENPAFRERLGLDRETTGIAVMEPEDLEDYPLKRWDVITAIGGYDVDNAGMIQWTEDVRLYYEYAALDLIENGLVPLTVFRDGELIELQVPARPERDLLFRHLEGEYPSYFVYGPMVFTPAYAFHTENPGWLGWLSNRSSPLPQRVGSDAAFDGEELVVLAGPILPHRITKSYELIFFPTLHAINGTEVKNLRHAAEIVSNLSDEYVEFTFKDSGQPTIVFKRTELEDAAEDILDENGIRNPWSDDLEDVFE